MNTLVEMINSMEVREDDETFKNAVDYMFDGLERRSPQHFAVRQYKKYKLASGVVSLKRLIALVDKYQNFEELTTYMLNEFVEKIVVHERDRKGSVETTQEVEIYFNFIGRYLPPHFGEVKMTPEEIEEMEKREARKDRLHQNYLRRKANGKQQEYYERTKAKKKAELDAKKEEIRQEDIAKMYG